MSESAVAEPSVDEVVENESDATNEDVSDETQADGTSDNPPDDSVASAEDSGDWEKLEREHYAEIQQAELDCEIAEEDFEIKNSQMKAAKKRLESKIDTLRELIRQGPTEPDPQQELPFDDDDEEAKAEAIENAWKAKPITEVITLTDSQKEKLFDAGVSTAGQFETLRAGTTDYPDGLISIKGIGEKKVTQWEEEFLNWLEEFRSQYEPSAEEQAEETRAELEDEAEPEADEEYEDVPEA